MKRSDTVHGDYRPLVYWAFRNFARSAFVLVQRMGFDDDWFQEIELATAECTKQRMGKNECLRYSARCAYAAFRSFGFRRGQHGKHNNQWYPALEQIPDGHPAGNDIEE